MPLSQASTSTFIQSATPSTVATPTKLDVVDGRSSHGGRTTSFESYCGDRQRETMSAADTDSVEARFSPPQLGQTPAGNSVVPCSSTVSATNTTADGVYSLFSVSAANNPDFASKRFVAV